MFSWFGSVFRSRLGKTAKPQEIPRYPPFPKGLPLLSPEELLKSQDELVRALLYAIDLDPKEAESLIWPILLRYAAFVHLLPASETHHHRGAGGLLRHGLEVALGCVKEIDSHFIFDTQRPPSERRILASRWRVAYAVSGLVHDIAKAYTDMRVVSPEGEVWSPFLSSLYDWGQRLGIERYFLSWKPDRHEAHESFLPILANQVLTPELLDWLAVLDGSVLNRLVPFISQQTGSIAQIVQKHDWRSVEEDLKRGLIDLFPASPPPEHRILSAMKRLIESRAWKINEPGARLWRTDQGVFLTWPQAAYDVLTELERLGQLAGIPKNPYELRDLMYERGILRKVERDGESYDFVLIAPEPLEDEEKIVYVRAVWLVQTGALFNQDAFEKVSVKIGLPENQNWDPNQGDEGVAIQKKPKVQPDSDSQARNEESDTFSSAAKTSTSILHEKAEKQVEISEEASRMLSALAGAAASHPDWVDAQNGLLAHPELAEAAGLDAGACVRVLFQAGCVEPDPANSLRKVTIHGGRSWLKIKRDFFQPFVHALEGTSIGALEGRTQDNASDTSLETRSQELVRLATEKLGLSQNELAKKLQVSPSYLSRIASGKRALPEDLIAKLEEALRQLSHGCGSGI